MNKLQTKREVRLQAIQIVLTLPNTGERSIAKFLEDVKLIEAYLLELTDEPAV